MWYVLPQLVNGAGLSTLLTVCALFVSLAPSSVNVLLATSGLASWQRPLGIHVLAVSAPASAAAAAVDVLIMDVTNTFGLGSCLATAFHPAPGVDLADLVVAAQLGTCADATLEGRSIVALAQAQGASLQRTWQGVAMSFLPFTARTQMRGVNLADRQIRLGALSAIATYVRQLGGHVALAVYQQVDKICRAGGVAMVVAEAGTVLGIITLLESEMDNARVRVSQLRRLGIATLLMTNAAPAAAVALAAAVGVDDYQLLTTAAEKLTLVQRWQEQGHRVALAATGADAELALHQADVALAMPGNASVPAAPARLVALSANPLRLLSLVTMSKQWLMTRNGLALFSFATVIAKASVLLPLVSHGIYSGPQTFNIMNLSSAPNALLATLFFNALGTLAVTPLALRGVNLPPPNAAMHKWRHVLWYGGGGLFLSFIGIKIIDMVLQAAGFTF